MSNIDDFIIHSQYPVEKIVWTAEGDNGSSNPHWQHTNFGDWVIIPFDDNIDWKNFLIDGVWTNDNWATQYPLGGNSKPMGYEDIGGSYSVKYDWLSSTTIPKGIDFFGYIPDHPSVAVSGTRSDPQTSIQYRLWAYLVESDWTSNTTEKTAETLAHSLQKNTSLAQLNMISENIIHLENKETKVLYHNLGFRPLCKIWQKWGDSSSWSKDLNTKTYSEAGYSLIENQITIDEEKITIYAQDDNTPSLAQDFLIRIFNYDIAV